MFDSDYDPTRNKITMVFNRSFSKAKSIKQRLGPKIFGLFLAHW